MIYLVFLPSLFASLLLDHTLLILCSKMLLRNIVAAMAGMLAGLIGVGWRGLGAGGWWGVLGLTFGVSDKSILCRLGLYDFLIISSHICTIQIPLQI